MKEKYIRLIVENLINQQKYSVIEINGQGRIPNAWCARINRNGTEKFLIFIDSERVNYISEYRNIIMSNTKEYNFSVEIYTIFVSENSENYWRRFTGESLEYTPLNNFLVIEISSNNIVYNKILSNDVLEDIEKASKNVGTNRRKVLERISHKESKVTMFLIAANILIYIITAYYTIKLRGGSIFNSDLYVLVLMGAKFNPAIAEGEYYRLFTCMFLHGGIMHLGFNMYALNAIGPLVEKVYGRVKYAAIYIFAGLCSSMLSYMFSDAISVGASGAIFGLLGAVLIMGFNMRNSIGKHFLNNILQVIAINIFIGLTIPNIDNFGHMGGLIGGLAVSMILFDRK
jgi:rhomboid protease GluP